MLIAVDAVSTGARRTKSEAAGSGERRYVKVARTTRRWRGGVEVKVEAKLVNRLLSGVEHAASALPCSLCFTADVRVVLSYCRTVVLQCPHAAGVSLWWLTSATVVANSSAQRTAHTNVHFLHITILSLSLALLVRLVIALLLPHPHLCCYLVGQVQHPLERLFCQPLLDALLLSDASHCATKASRFPYGLARYFAQSGSAEMESYMALAMRSKAAWGWEVLRGSVRVRRAAASPPHHLDALLEQLVLRCRPAQPVRSVRFVAMQLERRASISAVTAATSMPLFLLLLHTSAMPRLTSFTCCARR